MPVPRLHEELTSDVVVEVRAGTSVVLVGLPGSGRTWVLTGAAALLDDDGYHVLRIRGARALRDRPLEALAVSGLAADRPVRGASLLATYVTALDRLAQRGRFVLVVDDADDLDDDSVGAIVAAWGARPFPVVAATRPRPAPGDDRALISAVDPVVQIGVRALGYDETARLVETVLGAPVEASTAGRVHAKSGGMPGLARAIATCARRAGRLVRVTGTWHARGDLWTPLLAASVGHLLVGLSDEAVHGVRKLALTGPVSTETARRLLSWDTLEELDGHGLLRTFPEGAQRLIGLYPPLIAEQFRHAGADTVQLRVTEEIAAGLGESDPVRWGPRERDAAARLSQVGDGAPADEGRERTAVRDRLLADDVGRRRLVRGAEWEQDPTPATACRYLETLLMVGADPVEAARVVKLTPEHGDPSALLRLRGLDAVRLAVLDRDIEAAHGALLRDPPADAVSADPDLPGKLRVLDRRLTLMIEHVPDVADLVPSGPSTRAMLSLVQAFASLARGRPHEALATLDAEPGSATGSVTLDRVGQYDPGPGSVAMDDAQAAEARMERDRAVAQELALVLGGEHETGLALTSRHLDEATAARDVDGVWAHGYVRSLALGALGRFAELRDHVGAVLAVGMIPARQATFAVGHLALGAFVALYQGDSDAARTLARQAQGIGVRSGPWPFMSVGWFDGVVSAREAADAEAEADAFWAEAELLADRKYVAAAGTMGMLSLGTHPDRERTERLTQLLADAQGRSLRGFVTLGAALVAPSPDALVRLSREALDQGSPLIIGLGLRHAVRALRAAGDVAGAEQLIAEARSSNRLLPELLESFVADDPTATLTPREREIAQLVDAGLSNQQIAHRLGIAVSTVENHLNRVYRKLGVDGRNALAMRRLH